jgi:hypothetical protein
VVRSFTFDAGFFDEIGSTRIEWFDPEGNKIGQAINSKLGIETFTLEGGNIASWKISVGWENETGGLRHRQLLLCPHRAFRTVPREFHGPEGRHLEFLGDEIPGFDHVGFHMRQSVRVAPGYLAGTYVSATVRKK